MRRACGSWGSNGACGCRRSNWSGKITTLSSNLSVADATTRVGFNIGRINGRLLELELSALEQKQKVDIIASPRLLASHLQPASIKQGSEIPYQVSSGESGATSVEFKEAVLGMEVTPTVLQTTVCA
jgi:protein transport protein HofQ